MHATNRSAFIGCLSVIYCTSISALAHVAAADAAMHKLMVQVDPGPKALPPWIAQQRLDLSGAMNLMGIASDPAAVSVQVWRCDDKGSLVQRVACQFDVESNAPLVGVVSWPVEALEAGTPANYSVCWSDDTLADAPVEPFEPMVAAEVHGDQVVVSNTDYRVEHDQTRGGLWSAVTFLPSGKTDTKTIWRDGVGEYELRRDADAEVDVVAAGPLRAVVEVRARYRNEAGQTPPSQPRATYRYTHLAGQEYVQVEAVVEQKEAVAWPQLRIADVRPDTQFFTRYWMDHFSGKPWSGFGDLKQLGSHTTLKRHHGIMIGDHASFALAGPIVMFWDAGSSQDSYLRAHWQPWHTRRLAYSFYALLDGSADARGRFKAFSVRHMHVVPPRVVLEVEWLRQKAEPLLATYKQRAGALGPLTSERKAVANFALRRARTYLADGVAALNRGAFTRVGDLFKAASDEAAKTCFEQLTWDTKAAHGDAQGLETDDLLIISNRDMALAIDRDQFQLRGLYNPRTNKEFVSISSDAPAIDPVAVTLLTADHRELGAFGFAQARRRHEWRTTDDGIELVLHWRGLNVPDEPDSLDVEAVVRAGPEGMTQWSCRVTNRSARLGLRAIEFPLIGPLHAGTEEDPTDYSAQAEANPTARSGEIESMAMFQYQAYYGSRGGVYYGPQDSHWYEKKIRGRAQANTRTATLGHTYIAVNSHGEQVKTFEPTYETAVGVFEGDWYDAARRYRRWATKQPWCARGTLTERDDLPDWIRSVDLWTQGGGYTQEAFDDTLRVGLNFGRPMSVWVTHWMIHRFDNKYPDYFPPKMGEDAFIKAIAEGHRHGLTYMPYINAFIYATDAPSYTDEAAANGAKYLDGRPRGGIIAYLDNYLPYIAMCPATKFWQDKIAEIGAKIIQEYDCDGIYYDQVDNYRMECGDPTHGHPLGGGNSWTTGVREMYNRVRREALAATGKKVVFSSEFWHEQYIDEASVPLQQNSTNDSMYAHIRDVVYHDYVAALGFGLRGRPLLPFIGSIFITGAPGPTGLNGENLLGGEKPNAGALALLHYLSDCRRQFARKYLNLGARLRDPRIFTELPLIDRGGMARLMPAVITTAWEAADGDVACFFMNISNEAREFKYAIDLSRFALDSVGTYTVTRHELGETTVVEQQNAGRLRRTASLERAKLFMIQFSRETSGKSRNLP